MAKDLKHRIPSIREQSLQRKRGTLSTKSLGGLFALGIGAIALFYLIGLRSAKNPELQPPTVPAQPFEPSFTFFKLLEDEEVRIPEGEVNAERRSERMGKPPREGEFYVHAGAFRDRKNAQELKSTLEGLGKLRPHLEEIRLEYATWYRVRLGPYRSLREANQVRLFLREKSIDSILQGLK